jgi:outer membrane protein assembly factor BamB
MMLFSSGRNQVERRRIGLSGKVLQVAASADLIHLVTISADNDAQLETVSRDGEHYWRQELEWWPCDLRVDHHGSVWVGGNHQLLCFSALGERLGELMVPDVGEQILGAFLVTRDGLFVCAHDPSGTACEPHLSKLTLDGSSCWRCRIPVAPVAYSGVTEMRADNGWQSRQCPPWQPENWVADAETPMLMLGNRLCARFIEFPRSGIGRTYCLDLDTGRVEWATAPHPTGSVAAFDNAHLLVGSQGYDAFETGLYDLNGVCTTRWPSHGYYLVSGDGELRTLEMENLMPSRMRFSILQPDGSVRKGPRMPGYRSTYPVIDRQGTAAFWRDGKLQTVDSELRRKVLFSDDTVADGVPMSRALLLDRGELVLAIGSELWIFATGLAPMASSVWPCAEANLARNPCL